MRPLSIATNHSLAFILSALPDHPCHILDVGCGDGDLAHALHQKGHRLVALDQEQQCVTETLKKDVEAYLAHWPDFDPPQDQPAFDAVIFSRALHHMQDLQASVEKAYTLLKTGGVLLVEDFAYGETPVTTMEWFKAALERLVSTKKVTVPENSFCHLLLNSARPEQIWYHDHLYHIHPLGRMYREIFVQFEQCHLTHVPYLYRYVIDMVPSTAEGGAVIESLLQEELTLQDKDPAFLVGRRMMAHKI